MEMRPFDDQDWLGFAGAEAWPDSPPLIAESELADGMLFVLVLDKNGACLILDDEQATYGGYARTEPFPTPGDARRFADLIGKPKTREHFFALSFHPA